MADNQLTVLDNTLTFKNLIDDYNSLYFDLSLNGYGSIKMTSHKDYGIDIGDTIFVRPEHPYIVENISIVKENDAQSITVEGYEVKNILTRRITVPQDGLAYNYWTNRTAEYIVKRLVDIHLVTTTLTDPARAVSNLVIATNTDLGTTQNFNTRFKPLADEIEALLRFDDLGSIITVDRTAQEYIFDVYEGIDRSIGNGSGSEVVFSFEYDNLKRLSYANDLRQLKNYAYTGGQGEGIDREIVEVGTASGYDRREVFFDARDLELTADLEDRGQQRLSELSATNLVEGDTILNNYTYLEDFKLGDTVSLKDGDIVADLLITNVREVYENDQFNLYLTFNYGVIDLNEVLRQSFKNFNSESTK